MDETKNTPALILNRQSYREKDSLVTVYTQNYGKLKLIARGTKKLESKLAGHIEPLTIAEIMIIKGRGFDYIGSAITREAFPGIRADLNKLYYAGKAVNIFNRLVRDDETDAGLFFLLKQWLEMIDGFSTCVKDEGELLLSFFILKFLAELGYKPEMYKCLECGQNIESGENYFNLADGGVICGNCFQNKLRERENTTASFLPISDNCVKVIRFIMDSQLDRVEKLKIDKKLIRELAVLVEGFTSYRF